MNDQRGEPLPSMQEAIIIEREWELWAIIIEREWELWGSLMNYCNSRPSVFRWRPFPQWAPLDLERMRIFARQMNAGWFGGN